MGFFEVGDEHWKNMTVPEREELLHVFAPGRDEKDIKFFAEQPFDDLPGDVHGALIMGMTEEGFSFTKAHEVALKMREVANGHLPV